MRAEGNGTAGSSRGREERTRGGNQARSPAESGTPLDYGSTATRSRLGSSRSATGGRSTGPKRDRGGYWGTGSTGGSGGYDRAHRASRLRFASERSSRSTPGPCQPGQHGWRPDAQHDAEAPPGVQGSLRPGGH